MSHEARARAWEEEPSASLTVGSSYEWNIDNDVDGLANADMYGPPAPLGGNSVWSVAGSPLPPTDGVRRRGRGLRRRGRGFFQGKRYVYVGLRGFLWDVLDGFVCDGGVRAWPACKQGGTRAAPPGPACAP